jgi:carbon-monoxide dehydrogenase small subunit
MVELQLTINGSEYRVRVEPRRTLADVIRDNCGQTGTHIGCEHGVCGSCTVIIDGAPVRSCLLFAVQFQGKAIRTVEGLSQAGELHPLQHAFVEHFGLQCGFCTPGFLMLAASILERDTEVDEETLRQELSANLCRCTGYGSILEAVKSAQAKMRSTSEGAN